MLIHQSLSLMFHSSLPFGRFLKPEGVSLLQDLSALCEWTRRNRFYQEGISQHSRSYEPRSLCTLDGWCGGSSGTSVDLVRKHAVNIYFFLCGFDWKLVLETAATAGHKCSSLVSKYLNPDGFLPASRT